MTLDFAAVEVVLAAAIPRIAPAAQLVIRWRGEEVYAKAWGWLDPASQQHPTQLDTLFDLASITKLFVVTTCMTLVEANRVQLDQPVATLLPQLYGLRPLEPYEDPATPGGFVQVVPQRAMIDSGRVTVRQLLTHSAGLPAWRPLYQEPDAVAARRLALTTAYAYPPGSRILYSDIGLILVGLLVEHLSGERLDHAVRNCVTGPLGLRNTHYLPLGQTDPHLQATCAPTEICAWRERRLVGEVHDENAARLDGIAGHAGIFAPAGEVARFGQMFLDGGRPILHAATVAAMTRPQMTFENVQRGLGFALWSPDPEASSNPLSPAAFGHLGFTGTSLWIDPSRDLVITLLTNDVYAGRLERGIGPLRVELHAAIVAAIDAASAPATIISPPPAANEPAGSDADSTEDA